MLDDIFDVVKQVTTRLKYTMEDEEYDLDVYSSGSMTPDGVEYPYQLGAYFFDFLPYIGTGDMLGYGPDDTPLFVDILSYTQQMVNRSGDGKLLTLASDLYAAMLKVIVYGEQSVETPVNCTFSVNLPSADTYPYETAGYKNLYFNEQTGWSSWLEMNDVTLKILSQSEEEE